MMIVIYALCCPTTHEIKYVGRTKRIADRMRSHLSKFNKSKNIRLKEWIQHLIQLGLQPEFKILQTFREDTHTRLIGDAEQYFINKYLSTGNLLNDSMLSKHHEDIDVKRLHEIVRRKKIRYKILAEKMGVSYSSIAGYLTGQRCQLSLNNAKKLQNIIEGLA